MKASKSLLIAVSVLAVVATAAQADTVTVTINGLVEWNRIPAGYPLHDAAAADPATISFTVDSTNYVNSPNYPTRGYPINQNSFQLSFPADNVGLQIPFPSGQTPYFVIRHNDPQVDGFLVSTSYDWPNGVPINAVGYYSQLVNEFHVTYKHGTLPSLDVMDALGSYDYGGLEVFNWAIQDGGLDAMYIDYSQMSITPEPASIGLLALSFVLIGRRRAV